MRTDAELEEIRRKIECGDFYETSYPCDTRAFYDQETDTYYNRSGQRLRDPSEYDRDSEGYTLFGDEGY